MIDSLPLMIDYLLFIKEKDQRASQLDHYKIPSRCDPAVFMKKIDLNQPIIFESEIRQILVKRVPQIESMFIL